VRALCAELLRWEGSKPFMYADTRGHVTTGIGTKLAGVGDAVALPWQHRNTGLPATPAEIQCAFERVQARFDDFRRANPDPKESAAAGYYAKTTDLVLPPEAVTALASSRIEGFLKSLRRLFPGFDGYPIAAQRALVDMTYTLGAKGLQQKFPTLVAACRSGDFAAAARHCHRKVLANEHRPGDARNVITSGLFAEAARLTATIGTLTSEVRP
jgi:GH24 family phage-related lysozyme (muramidase)